MTFVLLLLSLLLALAGEAACFAPPTATTRRFSLGVATPGTRVVRGGEMCAARQPSFLVELSCG